MMDTHFDVTGLDDAIKRAVGLTQQQQAALAISENEKVMSSDPRPLGFVRHVDGREGVPETEVRLGGVIVYDYQRLDMVVEFALDTLRQLSPVASGNYARGHTLLLNNRPAESMKLWKPGDRVTISNPEPYTRKIELGREGFKSKGHVYEKAERIVSRRFGNMANVWFIFDTAPPGAIHKWASGTKMSSSGHASKAHRDDWLTRQPTLLIKEIS